MDAILFQQLCGVLANVVGITGFLIYLCGIFRNNEKPHIFSWILWCVVTLVIWYAQFIKGAGPAAWVTLVSAIYCGVVAVFAWKRGEKNITRSDWVVFVLSLSAIPLWCVLKDPLPSVLLLCVIDWASIYPMLRKSMINPWEENISFYSINVIKWTLTFFAIKELTLVNWLYPASLLIQNGLISAALYLRRQKVRR